MSAHPISNSNSDPILLDDDVDHMHHAHEKEEQTEAGLIGPISISHIFALFGTLAAGVLLSRYVSELFLPAVVCALIAWLIPSGTSGMGTKVRFSFALMAALLVIFVLKMWPSEVVSEKAATESATLLSWLIGLPIAGALFTLFLPRQSPTLIRNVTLAWMLIELGLSIPLLSTHMGAGFHHNLDLIWMPSLGIHYHVAIDGVSLWLVLLTSFIVPIATYASFGSVQNRIKDWCFSLLLLEGAMIGAFVALDLFLFYIFWELMLVPMYIMIGVWGGANRIRSAIKFFLYTMAGSVLMLAAILYLSYTYKKLSGAPSFDYFDLQRVQMPTTTMQVWLFAAFSLSFFIKVPMFPVHTWLPDAHTEAPTAGSVILAAVMLKMGTYGYLRFCMGLFPESCAKYAPILAGFAVGGGVLYGALCAWKQDDIKRLVAYSSVAHLGFVMLGLFAATQASLQGSVLQMVNHGISTGALFLLVGVIYDRRHTRLVADYGGISKVMPIYTTLFIIATMSSVGLPGLNGFVGEFMVITGTFVSTKLGHVNGIQATFAAFGVILAALYMLSMVQKVFFGPITKKENKALPDIKPRELLALSPLIAMMFIIGFFPKILLDPISGACERIERDFHARYMANPPGFDQKFYTGPVKLLPRAAEATAFVGENRGSGSPSSGGAGVGVDMGAKEAKPRTQ